MRKDSFTRITLLLLFASNSFFTLAQPPRPCGNYKIDMEAQKKAMAFEKISASHINVTTVLVRVYFHILSCNDGTLPGASAAQVVTEFNALIADYTSDNVCFLNAGIDNIYNTKLDSNFVVGTDNANLFDPFRVPGCINVFYVNKIKGTNTACNGNCGIGGIALGGIPGTFCLIAKSNVGKGQTTSHELGHCLGLLHTFETGNGFENIDGSNSTSSADLIADTPADPFAYNGQPCFATGFNACTYNGTCQDPKGSKNFNPPYSNLMAYWWNGTDVNGFFVNCYPVLALSPLQYTRVNSYLNTDANLKNCESPVNDIEANINLTSGFLMASGINSLTTSSSVIISGGANATFGGGAVFLEPGFHASPSALGVFIARTIPCN